MNETVIRWPTRKVLSAMLLCIVNVLPSSRVTVAAGTSMTVMVPVAWLGAGDSVVLGAPARAGDASKAAQAAAVKNRFMKIPPRLKSHSGACHPVAVLPPGAQPIGSGRSVPLPASVRIASARAGDYGTHYPVSRFGGTRRAACRWASKARCVVVPATVPAQVTRLE